MEYLIKDLPEEAHRQLQLMAAKEGKSVEQILVEAIASYYEEREIVYRRGMQNFDRDKGYQNKDQ